MHIFRSLRTHPHRFAVAIIALTTLIRLIYVATGQLNLVQDEAQYWDWTRHPQLSYYSKGPLISWIIALWTSIFGNTELGVRFGSVFNSLLTQSVLYYGIAWLWKKPTLGLWTLFVFNTMILFCGLSILMTTDSPLILCYAAFMFALYAALRPGDGDPHPTAPYVVLALSLALGTLGKYMMLIVAPQAILYAFSRRRLIQGDAFRKLLYALGIGTFLGLLPILLWNAQNDFVGFKHVAHLSGATGQQAKAFFRLDRFPDYFGSQIILATPWWLALLFVETYRRLRTSAKKTPDSSPLTSDQYTLLFLFLLPLWVFIFFWSFHTKIMPNWVASTYIPGAILAAMAMQRLWSPDSDRSRWLRYALPTLALGIFILAHTFHLLPIPNTYDTTRRVKGWSYLGKTVEILRLTKFENPNRVFIFSDQYDMTSALAFYVPGQPQTYCAWVDRRMSQYDLWPGPDTDKIGWDAILVYKDQDNPTPDNDILLMFQSISEPIYVNTTHDGRPARKFTAFLCTGYNGYWPNKGAGRF
ncbi:MAG: glycosyltransferase family 39 protein [Proteobacteria bacterium]|nr:glycosyltransferase family 39 protein [Pseudomonadota bacterium]MBU1612034.1 glycosyltransferase family 39 protein [Pseudomonadota bacterium]